MEEMHEANENAHEVTLREYLTHYSKTRKDGKMKT